MNKFLYIANSFTKDNGLQFQFLDDSFQYTCPILGLNSSYNRGDGERNFIQNHFEKRVGEKTDATLIKFIYED